MKISFFLSTIFLFLFVSSTSSQNDIYSKFGLEKNGCSVFINEEPDLSPPSISPPPVPPRKNPPSQSKDLGTRGSITDLSIFLSKNAALKERAIEDIELENGNIIFHENKLYGLKDKNGKIITSPTWTKVKKTTIGFVGYQKLQCYYYDFNGKKKYDKPCYFIKESSWGHTIIQTKNGFGLLDEKMKILIPPKYTNLYVRTDSRYMPNFYIAKDYYNNTYNILPDGKTIFEVGTYGGNVEVTENYIYKKGYSANIIDIKNGNPIFCGKGYSVTPIDREKKIAFLKNNDKREGLLIDYNGKIINQQIFKSIAPFEKNGLAIASIEKKNEEGESIILHGAINYSGEWVVNPTFHSMYFFNTLNNGYFWSVCQKNQDSNKRNWTLINKKNELITDYKYEKVSHLHEEFFMLSARDENNKITNDIIDAKKKEIIKVNAPYSRINKLILRETALYQINSKDGNIALNKDFNPIEEKESKCKNVVYQATNSNGKKVLLNSGFKTINKKEYLNINTKAHENSFQIVCMNFTDDVEKSSADIYNCHGELIEENKPIDVSSTYKNTSNDKAISFLYDKKNDKNYIINKKGEKKTINYNIQLISATKYEGLYYFQNAHWAFGLMDSDGNIILRPEFDELNTTFSGFTFSSFSSKKGFITKKGEFLFDRTFNNIHEVSEGVFIIMENNYWSVIDIDENILVSPTRKMIQKIGGLIFDGNNYYDLKGKLVK